ncbi:proline dehydrogenase family protein [Halostella salina]|uniref:proline dehydrogenase family protein n=1 Tax=Halostella salina TaxID=1547897 RepID=UPI000EF83065|nr:proline dehydrogenase family protein [Halostella salina]
MIPPIANQFVAGETPEGAVSRARQIAGRGLNPMVNRLGSHEDEWAAVETSAGEYRRLVDLFGEASFDAAVTIKPTQVGLEFGEDAFRETVDRIVDRASDRGVFVWFDMEEHGAVDATLDAYETLARKHGGGVGVCLQADLKRTRRDAERLADVPGKIRYVKGGAYDRPDGVAFERGARIDRAYRDLLADAFDRGDDGIAVTTHDPRMIEYARTLSDRHGADYEVQMLMGVRENAQRALADEVPVWQYVPYGPRWKRWVMNRTKNDVRFAARAVAGAVAGR